jgi:predicted ferric reductase
VPRKTLVSAFLVVATAGVVGLTLAARVGLVDLPLSRPDTRWFWYVARASGVTAYLALAAATIWGLLVSTGLADWLVARGRSVEMHQWLAAVGLVLAVGHGVTLVGDSYIRFDALDLLVPFLAPYRPVAVGMGTIGLYLAAVVYASFSLRARLGMRRWRALHALSFPAFAMLTWHGVLAGWDGGSPWLRLMYAVSAGVVLWLTFYRALTARSARQLRPEAAQAA